MSITKKQLIITAVLAGVVTLAVAIVLLDKPTVQEPTLPDRPAVSDLTVENLLREVNEERQKVGVAPLVIDPLLNKSAQLKADEIARTGVFEHIGEDGKNGPTYAIDVGVQCARYGESLAADTNAQGAVNDWLGSPLHKAGMLNEQADTTGFGISDGPGYSYVVQHFCDLP